MTERAKSQAHMEASDLVVMKLDSTLWQLRPQSNAARQWFDENAVTEPWQWIEGVLHLNPMAAKRTVRAIGKTGLTVHYAERRQAV